MCGIAGIISKNTADISIGKLKKMTDAIAHRGPDGEGQWVSDNGEVGLGHRRLSIIDLSLEANQPMHYMDRYSIVYNGEIYNYIELREQLLKQGYSFKTSSDTEVLMALYDRDKEKCLQLLDGMFSFVLYDEKEKSVFIARDRFGEKPFYYSFFKGSFYFGSEMKALWAGGIPKEYNNRMLFNYLAYGYLKNPEDIQETFFKDIFSFPHSSYTTYKVGDTSLSINKYWDIDILKTNETIKLEDAKAQFYELMFNSVKLRLRSDVPVGSSLSGGLDSSLIVCIIDELNKNNSISQNTFSARFPGFAKDEGKFMQYVIDKTKVIPHFITPSGEGMLEDFDKLCYHQEEPFGSASIYAQYCVMKLAKENNVTVLLDGQAADEILAGYHIYFIDYFNELKKHNHSLYIKELAAYNKRYTNSSINPASRQNGMRNLLKIYFPNSINYLKKVRLQSNQLISNQFNKDFFATYKNESFIFSPPAKSLNESLSRSTMNGYALQDLLRYADRNSMAHSREVRLPFLSHELVEFLFTVPSKYKINQGWTKWIMRATFDNILPTEITWREDKIGYEPPQKNWMKNKELKDKVIENRKKMVAKGILNTSILSKIPQAENANSITDNTWQHLMLGGYN
jgi:asparagine synthase (glutamine-hydrolysing)